MKKPNNDLTGQKFGKLTAEEYLGYIKNRNPYWKCRCECGNHTIATTYNLINGNTTSCGCLRRGKEFSKYKHGLCHHKLYHTYHAIKQRYFNRKCAEYKHYGERGISVCGEWLGENGFVNFYNWSMENGYAEGLSIDRIDNDGNYEPSNCRWADNITQLNNTSRNRTITYNGETHTYAEWEKILDNGVTQVELSARINKLHWDTERALLTPIKNNRKPELYNWNEKISYNGRTQTIKEWCDEMGLSGENYRSRIKLGWDKTRAATERKHFDKAKELINK